jgi:hypothetical protein
MDDRNAVKKEGIFVSFLASAGKFPAGQLRSEKVNLVLSPNMIHGLTNVERMSHNK